MVYAFLGALAWASLDALRKRLSDSMDVVALSTWVNGGALPAFLVWVVVSGADGPRGGYWLPGMGSVVLGLLAQLLFLLALRWAQLGTAIPMLALTPAFASGLAWVGLGEVPEPREGLGLTLIVVGCVASGLLATRESGRAEHPVRGALAMAAVALMWSANGVIDKVALQHTAPAAHAAIVASGTVVVLLGVLAVQGALGRLVPAPADRPALAASVATLGLAYGFQLLALSAIPVGLVEGIKRGLGVPAALANGWGFFGEAVSWPSVLAAGIVVVGLMLVT